MKRRHFLKLIVAALAAGVMKGAWRYHRDRVANILTYLDRQLTPAAAAQAAANNAAQYGKLGEGDIFWSVMWPYMYAVGRAEGTVENSFGIDPYKVYCRRLKNELANPATTRVLAFQKSNR